MMINKKLIGTVRESKKYIAGNIALQWCALVANIIMMAAITYFLGSLFQGMTGIGQFLLTGTIAIAAVIIRAVCTIMASCMSCLCISFPEWTD